MGSYHVSTINVATCITVLSGFINPPLSYSYNQSGLSVEPFVSLWIQYSENYLYLSCESACH